MLLIFSVSLRPRPFTDLEVIGDLKNAWDAVGEDVESVAVGLAGDVALEGDAAVLDDDVNVRIWPAKVLPRSAALKLSQSLASDLIVK